MTLFALHGSAIAGGAGRRRRRSTSASASRSPRWRASSTPPFTRLSAPRYATVIAAAAGAAAARVPDDPEPGRLGAGPDRGGPARPVAAHHRDPPRPAGAALAARPPGAGRPGVARPTPMPRARPTSPAARRPDPADPPRTPPDSPPRPESAPEEPDLIIAGLTGRRRRWLPTRIFPGPRPAGAPAGRLGAARPAGHPAVGRLAARADLRAALLRQRGRPALLHRRPCCRPGSCPTRCAPGWSWCWPR